ncbi:hypothetical protein Sjap_002867 [Stephania japonica]|uniref:Reverse transcriptase zinc-binding domain-containing protein n=1 Tax=Stephania japonica TaxID=461633 RepID=A0AAP0KPU0_9MAGN
MRQAKLLGNLSLPVRRSLIMVSTIKWGIGGRISFWDDNWMRRGALEELFPQVYVAARSKSKLVTEMIREGIWDLRIRPRVNANVGEESQQLLSQLQMVQLNSDREDACICHFDHYEKFTVCSAFQHLAVSDGVTKCEEAEAIWRSLAPTKVKFFTWLVLLEKVSVAKVLQRRRHDLYISPSCCIICHRGAEMVEHTFLRCVFVSDLWERLAGELDLRWVPPGSIKEVFERD